VSVLIKLPALDIELAVIKALLPRRPEVPSGLLGSLGIFEDVRDLQHLWDTLKAKLLTPSKEADLPQLSLDWDRIGFGGDGTNPRFIGQTAVVQRKATVEEGYRPILKQIFQCLRDLKAGVEAEYTVRAGDSLWRIAEAHYGLPAFYHAIASRNRHDIATPLRVGQKLTLPSACPKRDGAVLMVENGSSLWSMMTGRKRRPPLAELLKTNPTLLNPDRIYPGQLVVVPDGY
jgi:hypothetical protein